MYKHVTQIAAAAVLLALTAPAPSLATDRDDLEELGYLDHRGPLVVPETVFVHPRPLVRETAVIERHPIFRRTVIVDRRPIVEKSVVVDRRPIVRRTVVVDRRPVIHKTVIVEPRPVFRRPYGFAGLWRD